jgi:opacity protein-like surface antigen
MNPRSFQRNRMTAPVLVAAALAAALATAPAHAEWGASRAQNWEFYIGANVLMSETIDFRGGSSIELDEDLGVALGFAYNVNEHLLLGGEMIFNSVSYEGVLPSADDPPAEARRILGELDIGSIAAMATWHFLPGTVTPYVSGSVGWTWIDTNIATGPPTIGCWWDPWFGYICRSTVNTRTEESFSYAVGAGMRWDFGWGGGFRGFGRVGYDRRWVDFSNSTGSPALDAVRVEFGARF